MDVTDALINLHVVSGSIALLIGLGAIIWKKGDKHHKKMGVVFFYSMLGSSLLSILIANLPGHENPFLFSIGVFTVYMLLGGKQALKFRGDYSVKKTDYILPSIMLLAGLFMIITPVFLRGEINIVSCAMGLGGILFGIRDIRLFRKPDLLQKKWLQLHVGKIVGSYISAVTAFTVNQVVQGIWGWFAPGIIGGIYITVWMIKLGRKPQVAG